MGVYKFIKVMIIRIIRVMVIILCDIIRHPNTFAGLAHKSIGVVIAHVER